MDGFFEIIMPILILVGGLIGVFGKSENRKQTSDQQSPNRPTQTTQTRRQTEQRKRTVHERQQENIQTLSIEEQRDQQMERLREQIKTGGHRLPEQSKTSSPQVVHSHKTSYEFEEFKKDMKRNLTKQGLIDSIIMAEVLGSPRARKPYRSIIYERKNI